MLKSSLYTMITMTLSISIGFGSTYTVGSDHTYPTPNALYIAGVVMQGDTIYIEGEDYIGTQALAVWDKDNLIIQGINGRPHLKADGEYIWGKGIWVLAGNDIHVKNIEFSGAKVPDKNGAGIRLDGVGLMVSYCHFHDNETGILSNSPYDGDVIVEFSEFGYNGNGDGQSHNIYINHVENFIFRNNYSHHAIIGHCVKSRADNTYILYNKIMDHEDGQSSRLIDIPNGGTSVIIGNTMMQGPTAENKNAIGYGLEGLINTTAHDVYIINNTLLSTRPTPCLFLDIASGTNQVRVINNVFGGKGELVKGTIDMQSNNYFEDNISDLYLLDSPNLDYRPTADSPIVDQGLSIAAVNGINLTPVFEYDDTSLIDRVSDGAIDIGAFEYDKMISSLDEQCNTLMFYPNPTEGLIQLKSDNNLTSLKIFNYLGMFVADLLVDQQTVNLSHLPSGMYYIINLDGTKQAVIKK